MSAQTRLTPNSSQTVGPFFRIGLQAFIDDAPVNNGAVSEAATIHGRILDRDGAPVPDGMLEFWTPDSTLNTDQTGFPQGFRRAATDIDGNFSVSMRRPAPFDSGDGRQQAPHVLVLIFARGLLRHLISRVYFDDEEANALDPVLLGVPAERRHTLIARGDARNSYRWDVILQGNEETVFFAW